LEYLSSPSSKDVSILVCASAINADDRNIYTLLFKMGEVIPKKVKKAKIPLQGSKILVSFQTLY
jgi:hypothetical protein